MKGLVTNSGPVFPLDLPDLLLAIVDLENLEKKLKKKKIQYDINQGKYIERYEICLVHE